MSFTLPIPSEVAGVLNFIISDIVIISYIMYASSIIAGCLNHSRLRNVGKVHLVIFDCPLIGGGIVMDYGWPRTLLIMFRASAVLAVVIANFGLEGRSLDVSERRSLTVRIPGDLPDFTPDALFNATERPLRCNHSVKDSLIFGSVLDDICFPEDVQHVYIRSMSLVMESFNYTVTGCRKLAVCEGHYTKYHCDHSDFACGGVDNCENSFPGSTIAFCHAIIYDKDDSFYCKPRVLNPDSVNELIRCRRIGARKQDIENWVNLMFILTLDPIAAIFGSAYGQSTTEEVNLPLGERNRTVVTLFWIVPQCWLLFVLVILTAWLLNQVSKGGMKHVANDERGLAMLLDRALLRLENRFDMDSHRDPEYGSGTAAHFDEEYEYRY